MNNEPRTRNTEYGTQNPETEWVETIANGWNILSDYTSPNFEYNLINFNPQNTPKAVFGENVAKPMVELLLSF